MTFDRRLTPCNGRVAARYLEGVVDAERFVDGTPMVVATFAAALRAAPGGAMDRQVLLGEAVQVYETREGWSFVQAQKDGYVGWMQTDALAAPHDPTHRVTLRHTLAFAAPDIKSPLIARAPFGALLKVQGRDGAWHRVSLPDGASAFVRHHHLVPIDCHAADPVAEAEKFLGTPYLWAGNTGDGLDCSGLVQAALLACGIASPGDSDLMEAELGEQLPPDAALQRGDLAFWKGHVAMVRDEENLIHASAAQLAVVIEGIDAAIERIAAAGEGLPTLRRRIATLTQRG